MLYHALIITSRRDYAQAMRQALLRGGDAQTRVDIELDPLRATQLGPQHYEWILLDSVLDGMDGVQLLLLIKQQAPASRYIIVSDTSDEITRAVAYQNGADFFLERPTNPEGFMPALQAIQGLLPSSEVRPTQEVGQGAVVAISDIVQMRCLSGDSVLLMVRSQFQSGDIFIYRGDVFHAQYPGKSGEAAFHDMLRWDGGLVRIRVAKLTHIPPRTIEIPYRQLLETVQKPVSPAKPEPSPTDGELFTVPGEKPSQTATLSVIKEAPPREDDPPIFFPSASTLTGGETPLPRVNSHWMVNLSGDLLEGSQVSEPDRCAFITSFIYRKLADVAVALETDYFNHLTLLGPHLQQVLVADNMGVRHAVFDTAWTTEEMRVQYVKWCREQSF